jgi:DNA primase
MEIQQIKQTLRIQTVLEHYGLQPDKNGKLHCPFHEDKTASLQLYPKTDTWHCFGCGATGDQVEFCCKMEGDKHKGILKAGEMVEGRAAKDPNPASTLYPLPSTLVKIAILTKMFNYFKSAVYNSPPAKEYLKNRSIDWLKTDVGYNTGQFHHGTRKDEALIQSCLQVGLLNDVGLKSKTGDKAYSVFGKYSLCFALRNKENQVTGLYFRSTVNESNQKHYYLKEREGLYPGYPKAETKILILTEAIIDAATLLQIESIALDYTILSLYGTNGFTEEHKQAITGLKHLEEVIFFFDGDEAGRKAMQRTATAIHQVNPQLRLSFADTPDGEDINSLAVSHAGQESELFTHLIEHRKPFITSTEPLFTPVPTKEAPTGLDTSNPDYLYYQTETLQIRLWGGIEKDNLSRLKINVHVQRKDNKYKTFRDDVNLYSHVQVQKLVKNLSETLEIPTTEISQTLTDLTEALEEYRMQLREQTTVKQQEPRTKMTDQEEKQALTFLKSNDLLQKTSDLIQQGGLVGEAQNGLLLFLLYLSRIMDEPLHAIIFGKSGSGKTYLQTKVSECLPEESLRTVTSLSENTLYYSPPGFWKHKVLLIEDLEGVYNAFLPLREMMSKQSISKLTTDKDPQGNNVQKVLLVEGPICVSGATTKESIYEDNANRSFLLHIDESSAHLNEVMNHQRKVQAGLVNEYSQQQSKDLLKNAQRLLKPIKVINPYALKLQIPDSVFKKLRTNMHYLKLIEIITFYHQQQRAKKKDGYGNTFIETSLEDIQWANELIKDTLLKKSDELSGELRNFFETLKTIHPQKETAFYAKDIRKKLRMHPQKLSRFLFQLEQRSYVKKTGSNPKQGFEYLITAWEEYTQLRQGMNIIDEILQNLSQKQAGSHQLHTTFTTPDVKLDKLSHSKIQEK